MQLWSMKRPPPVAKLYLMYTTSEFPNNTIALARIGEFLLIQLVEAFILTLIYGADFSSHLLLYDLS